MGDFDVPTRPLVLYKFSEAAAHGELASRPRLGLQRISSMGASAPCSVDPPAPRHSGFGITVVTEDDDEEVEQGV